MTLVPVREPSLCPSTDNAVRFVHLNVHSNYSFCRGASRLEELVVAARRRGMDAMALTDTNGLHGLIWFLEAAKTARDSSPAAARGTAPPSRRRPANDIRTRKARDASPAGARGAAPSSW